MSNVDLSSAVKAIIEGIGDIHKSRIRELEHQCVNTAHNFEQSDKERIKLATENAVLKESIKLLETKNAELSALVRKQPSILAGQLADSIMQYKN